LLNDTLCELAFQASIQSRDTLSMHNLLCHLQVRSS
jgi:hypothetical protein